MARAILITNPAAARTTHQSVKTVSDVFRRAGWQFDVQATIGPGSAKKIASHAVRDSVDLVVVQGGDGTTMQAAAALVGSDVALGLVPGGTGNLLAGNLGVPADVDKAVKVLLEGAPRQIDLGRVKIKGADRDFAVACGVGFDAKVMDATDPNQKRRWGKLAYVAAAVREGRNVEEVSHEITIDGRTITMVAA